MVELRDDVINGMRIDERVELYVQMRGAHPLDSTRLSGGCVAPRVAQKIVCEGGNFLIKHKALVEMPDGRRYQILRLEFEGDIKSRRILKYFHSTGLRATRIARVADTTEVSSAALKAFPDDQSKCRFLKSVVRAQLPEDLVGPYSDAMTAVLAKDNPAQFPATEVAREMVEVSRAMKSACGGGVMAFTQPN